MTVSSRQEEGQTSDYPTKVECKMGVAESNSLKGAAQHQSERHDWTGTCPMRHWIRPKLMRGV